MAQSKPLPATRPDTMALDNSLHSSLPRTSLNIPMPSGAKPPPAPINQKPAQ